MAQNDSDEEQSIARVNIHGHSVLSDDLHGMRYLRKLDPDEAKTIFQQAKTQGSAEFETRTPGGRRHNYSARYKNGRYTLKDQGREEKY